MGAKHMHVDRSIFISADTGEGVVEEVLVLEVLRMRLRQGPLQQQQQQGWPQGAAGGLPACLAGSLRHFLARAPEVVLTTLAARLLRRRFFKLKCDFPIPR